METKIREATSIPTKIHERGRVPQQKERPRAACLLAQVLPSLKIRKNNIINVKYPKTHMTCPL